MKTAILTLAVSATLVGAADVCAQFSADFGPWTSTGTFTDPPLIIGPFDNPPQLKLTTVFDISGSLTPGSGSPPGETTYNITYNTVLISLASPFGDAFSPDPLEINLGPVSFSVTVQVTGGGVQIDFTAPPAIKTQYITLNGGYANLSGDFTVTWVDLSLPVEGGGKNVTFNNVKLQGEIAVPEPGQFALAAGLGLIGFAGWRRSKE